MLSIYCFHKKCWACWDLSRGYRDQEHRGLWELQEPGQRDDYQHKDFRKGDDPLKTWRIIRNELQLRSQSMECSHFPGLCMHSSESEGRRWLLTRNSEGSAAWSRSSSPLVKELQNKNWKQPRYPLVGDWCSHAIKYYSAIKRNGLLTHAITWIDLEGIMCYENESVSKGFILDDSILKGTKL